MVLFVWLSVMPDFHAVYSHSADQTTEKLSSSGTLKQNKERDYIKIISLDILIKAMTEMAENSWRFNQYARLSKSFKYCNGLGDKLSVYCYVMSVTVFRDISSAKDKKHCLIAVAEISRVSVNMSA